MSSQTKETWTGKLGFVLSSVGSAVGLGAIWKFPYMAGAGGGATFLIPYVILSFSLAFGLLLAELVVGKAGRGGIVTAYRNLGGPVWGIIGYLGIIVGFILLSFYSVVGGWCLLYLYEAVIGFPVDSAEKLGALFGQLSSSPSVAVTAQIAFLLMVGGVVAYGIRGGIEVCSRILMPVLFFFMLVLIVVGLSQPGAWKGVKYLFYPDFSKFSWRVLLDSMGLVFFSYSTGCGCMLTYGAYLDKNAKLMDSALWIITLSLMISILAGLMILPANFAFGMDPAAGPGLTFITMPAIFAKLPFGQLLSIAFFVCLIVAALTSAVSMLEIDITWMVQELKIGRVKAVTICLIFMTLLSVPCALSFGVLSDYKIFNKTIFDLCDFIVSNLGLPIGGVLTAVLAAWFCWDKLHNHISSEPGYPAWKKVLRVVIGIFCPALVLIILVTGLIN